MISTTLHSELASWTSRALQVSSTYSPMVRAPGAAARVGEPTMATMSTVVSALKRTARHLNQRHPLCNLPRSVILCICSYLAASETLLLSHTSHAVRTALLGVPDPWSGLPIISIDSWLEEDTIPQTILSTYMERSDPLPFDASLVLAGSVTISTQVSLVAGNMHRMAALRFLCLDRDSEPPAHSWLPLLRQIFSEPAPQLATLDIFHSVRFPVETPSAFEAVTLADVFRAATPSLRRVKLCQLRLPATLDYPGFQNVTIFVYDLFGPTTSADLHVLSSMPKLEVFQWGGDFALPTGDAATDNAAMAYSYSRSLHTVLLSSRNDLSMVCMRGLLPVESLRELWITTRTHDTCVTIPDLYAQSTVRGASVCCSSSGLVVLLEVVHAGDSGSTTVVVNTRRVSTLVSSLLEPFSSITWLSIYEHLWDSEVTGTSPVLPAVTVLSVCLRASSDNYDRDWQAGWDFGPWSAGVFTADPACRWALPALRQIRITSPPKGERSPESAEGGTLSVSLDDIARWIRDGIAIEPPARKLDAVVLSGVRIIDHNFCAAWDTIMSLSRSLELCETPDTLHHTCAADMNFSLRASSFGDDRFHIW